MLATTVVLLLLLVGSSLPIGISLFVLALALDAWFTPLPLHRALGDVLWHHSHNSLLVTIPLFVMMGEIITRSGLGTRMYGAMIQWLGWLPGGLMHANIGTGALLAASSGSSVATTATIATTALQVQDTYGYRHPIYLGSIAAGGSLGILIPPSLTMILYGFLTNTSIPGLFIAGIVPGLLLCLLYMLTIGIVSLVSPAARGLAPPASWAERFATLGHLVPPVILFVAVIGSIYAGLATPTEAASIGVLAAVALALVWGRLDRGAVREVLLGTVRTSCMMLFITVAAMYLNFVLATLGVAGVVERGFRSLELEPLAAILLLVLMYTLLGMFMDSLAAIVLTVPFVTPIAVELGYSPLWFGIFVVMMTELAMLTPPIGMACFIIQGIRRRGRLEEVFWGILPFALVLYTLVGLITLFPGLVLWLPGIMAR